jgi:hypothetical protein
VYLLLFGQQANNMQKPLEAGFGAFPGSEGTTVKPFPGGEVPLAPYTEKSATAKGNWPFFSGPALGIHVISCAPF